MVSYEKTMVENAPPPVVITYRTVHILRLTDSEIKSLKFLLNAVDSTLVPDLADLKRIITQDPEIVQAQLDVEVRKRPDPVAPGITPDKLPASVTLTEVP